MKFNLTRAAHSLGLAGHTVNVGSVHTCMTIIHPLDVFAGLSVYGTWDGCIRLCRSFVTYAPLSAELSRPMRNFSREPRPHRNHWPTGTVSHSCWRMRSRGWLLRVRCGPTTEAEVRCLKKLPASDLNGAHALIRTALCLVVVCMCLCALRRTIWHSTLIRHVVSLFCPRSLRASVRQCKVTLRFYVSVV